MVSVRFRPEKISSGPEKNPPEIRERVESGQHAPEGEGGGDGDPHDRAQPGGRTQIISLEPCSGSDLKFSSRRTQVMQRISRKTISDGLNGASLRVPDTRWRAI